MDTILLLLLLTVPDAPPPAAMVLHSGGATVAKEAKPVSDLDLLQAGAALQAGKEDLTVMILKAGVKERIRAGTEVTLGVGGCSPSANVTRQARRLGDAQLGRLRALIGERGGVAVAGRSMDKLGTASGLTPLHTAKVLTGRPTFSWDPVEGAQSYEFCLYRDEKPKRRMVWQGRTTKPTYAFPPKGTALEPGVAWEWDLYAARKGEELTRVLKGCKFAVLGREAQSDADALHPLATSKDPADRLLAAVNYEALGLYDRALALYLKVDRDHPGSGAGVRALVHLYGLANRLKQQEEVRNRLMKLRAGAEADSRATDGSRPADSRTLIHVPTDRDDLDPVASHAAGQLVARLSGR